MVIILRIAALISLITLTGCISIDIQPKEFKLAGQTQFSPPPASYEEQKTPDSDHTWVNKKIGSKISFVSECGSISSLNLKTVANSVIAPTQMKIEKQTMVKYHGNDALASIASHKELSVRLKLVTEKTENCIYNFALLAPVKSFETAEADFETFLQGVRPQ